MNNFNFKPFASNYIKVQIPLDDKVLTAFEQSAEYACLLEDLHNAWGTHLIFHRKERILKMEQNSIKLTSVDDVVNFFIAVPHCSLTMEQLAETAFKIAEKRNIESIVTIVPNNIIDIALDVLKKVGKEIVSYYDLELEDYEKSVKSNYDKEYAIWIDFNAYDDNKYRLGVELPYHKKALRYSQT